MRFEEKMEERKGNIMTYYITAKSASSVSSWEPCKAKTLNAAKAASQMAAAWIGDIPCVGVIRKCVHGQVIEAVAECRRGAWANV